MRRIIDVTVAAVASLLLTTPVANAFPPVLHDITYDVVSHETTGDIHVWAPVAEGDWPVVYALHGTGVDFGTDWDVIARALVPFGYVVFAPDYHADAWKSGEWAIVEREAECAYRYARDVAPRYGGDLDLPVIFLGHSIGGTYALGGGLGVERFGPEGDFDACLEGAPRPDIIVPIGSCHYGQPGREFPFDVSTYGTGDARLVFVAAEDDEVCPAWQSRDAAEASRSAGYQATYVEVPGAHLTRLGHDVVDEQFVTLEDHPAPAAIVGAIIDVVSEESGVTEG